MATTTTRRRQPNNFDIHEDGPSTEDTEMNTDAAREAHGEEDVEEEEGYADEVDVEEPEDEDQAQEPEVEQESEQEEQQEDDFSEDEAMDEDMRKLQDAFPGFKHKYRLIKRIGEGTVTSPCQLMPLH